MVGVESERLGAQREILGVLYPSFASSPINLLAPIYVRSGTSGEVKARVELRAMFPLRRSRNDHTHARLRSFPTLGQDEILTKYSRNLQNRMQQLEKEYQTLKENDPAELQKAISLTQVGVVGSWLCNSELLQWVGYKFCRCC